MPQQSRRPAVFLDRDGVLNRYLPGDYVRTPAMLAILPSVADAVARFGAAGLPVIVISNQQGVAKGLMSARDLDDVDDALRAELLRHNPGARIAASRYCTHHTNDACDCRKPSPGLLLRAAEEFGIDLTRSVFVGDTETDALASRAASIGAFVLLLSGKFAHEGRDMGVADDRTLFPIPPDFVALDLGGAADWILARLG